MSVSLIVARTMNDCIGLNNALPWHLPKDFRWFKDNTRGKPVVMGRLTYESIGKPLPDRLNIIVTRNPNFKADGCIVVNTPQAALDYVNKMRDVRSSDEIMVMGGKEIYLAFLPKVDKIYLTTIYTVVVGDTYLSDITDGFVKDKSLVSDADERNEYSMEFSIWHKEDKDAV